MTRPLSIDDPAVRHAVDRIPAIQPFDEHNQTLLSHVHPPDWVNPTPLERYNMVVIGAGTAGLVTAAGAAGLGAKVALVERSLMGGDCLNVGCVPSKALLRSARAVADVNQSVRYGVRGIGTPSVDFGAVMKRMRRLRSRIAPHDSAQRFRDLGVDVFIGEARFTGPRSVAVGEHTLRFSKACIATGARAAEPPIPGLHEAGFVTNETVFSLTELPERVAVIGGGPIGCELAQAFARFGSEVTLVEAAGQILIREDRDAVGTVEAVLRADGIDLLMGTTLSRVESTDAGKRLLLDGVSSPESLTVDTIILTVGRSPNVDGLGLDAAGVEIDAKRGVRVDDRLRTTNKHVYAAGDVCFPYQFTHTADATARIVIGNALFWGRSKASALTIPWCTYTDPEVAHVGLYPHEAAERGIDIDTYQVELRDVDRSLLEGETDGFLKVHTRRGKGAIVGATLVGRHAGDLISEVTLAMTSGAGLGGLSSTIHPYPTTAEAIKRAADAYNRTRLTPFVAKLLKWILTRRR